jgi:hypothetical protein
MRRLCSSDVLQDVEVDRLANIFSIVKNSRITASRNLPPISTIESIPIAVSTCQRALGLSQNDSALDLPDRLDSVFRIVTWKIPLAATSGGYFSSGSEIHIVVSDHSGISPWQSCARQLGRILSNGITEVPCFFEPIRFDNTTEKRTLNSKANKFALEFLMPAHAFVTALRSIRRASSVELESPMGDIDLLWLSRIFGTSFFSAGKRAEQLGLLPSGASAALTEILSQKHGGPEGRARSLGLPLRPDHLFPRITNLALTTISTKLMRGELDKKSANSLFGSLLEAEQRAVH